MVAVDVLRPIGKPCHSLIVYHRLPLARNVWCGYRDTLPNVDGDILGANPELYGTVSEGYMTMN